MTLAPGEFIRRFLLHVLPRGFHRIRHYGLLAASARGSALARVRELLTVPPVDAAKPIDPPGPAPCSCCGGRMRLIEILAALPRRARHGHVGGSRGARTSATTSQEDERVTRHASHHHQAAAPPPRPMSAHAPFVAGTRPQARCPTRAARRHREIRPASDPACSSLAAGAGSRHAPAAARSRNAITIASGPRVGRFGARSWDTPRSAKARYRPPRLRLVTGCYGAEV